MLWNRGSIVYTSCLLGMQCVLLPPPKEIRVDSALLALRTQVQQEFGSFFPLPHSAMGSMSPQSLRPVYSPPPVLWALSRCSRNPRQWALLVCAWRRCLSADCAVTGAGNLPCFYFLGCGLQQGMCRNVGPAPNLASILWAVDIRWGMCRNIDPR